jgi:hypothetical protein
MSLADAKIVLSDVLGKQYSDSLVKIYTLRDSIQNNVIILQKEALILMSEKFNNQKTISDNLNQVLANKDTEIALLNETIKKQKKEIRKQKFLKVLGFTAAVVLPITTMILISH